MIVQDSTRHAVDTLQRVQNLTHGKFSVFESYFFHLAKNPERIDSLLMWGVATLFLWILMLILKREMINGLKGSNLIWEGGEQVTYFALMSWVPVVFRTAFFNVSSSTQVIALYIITGIIAYQVFGRYIFDWALAFKGGLSSVPAIAKDPTTVTTETTTTVKP